MSVVGKLVVALSLATVAWVAVGCSGAEPGSPVVPSVAASETAADEVPKVPEPLDISSYLEDPCGLVSQDFLKSLDYEVKPGKKRTGDAESVAALVGPGCGWNESDGIRGVAVNIQTGNRENGLGGLQGLYDAYKRGQFEYWEPLTIDGYPAASANISDLRDRGECMLIIGIEDDLSFTAHAGGYTKQPQQACTDAKQVAEQVIATLKGGS